MTDPDTEFEDTNVDDVDEVDDDEGFDPNRKPAATATTVLEYLVRAVVDDPDGVEVNVNDDRLDRVQLNVTVAPGDMGRVIGRRGRVANAIRTVVRAAAVRDDVDVDVEFVD